ncbi:MAG: peptidyl-tRNA hydrolase [Gemmatimonadota bacterium]|nr:MAG: peptidyl-tRNA hydrolase [Gemmatimonadota bacterium]
MAEKSRSEAADLPEPPDFLVLGLGNPGERYRQTRHNFGFLVTDALASLGGSTLREGPGPSLIGSFTVDGNRGMLAQPLTWMNRSGIAARAILDRFGGPEIERVLVVTDDLDLPLGRMRIRRGGGPGGHNGLRSLIEELGTPDFPRIRLGIGRPDGDERDAVVDYVLEAFRAEELAVVQEVVDLATEGVRVFLREGADAAMSRFNAG